MFDLVPSIPPASPSIPPNDGQDAHLPKFRLATFWAMLAKHWWIPALTLCLSLAVTGILVRREPPTYVSIGSIWETMKLQYNAGPFVAENTEELSGTQNDLMHSALIGERVLAKLRAATNGVAIPLDANGRPIPVKVRITQSLKSAVFALEAMGSDSAYVQAYLDALMQAYLEYKAEIRKQISGDTMTSIAKQVELAAQALKDEQEILSEFERTNDLAILQEEGTIAGGYLTKLKTQLSDLESDEQLLAGVSQDLAAAGPNRATNTTPELRTLMALSGGNTAPMAAEIQNKAKELDLLKLQRAQLSVILPPEHPQIRKLDDAIALAESELTIDREQCSEQLAAATETAQQRIAAFQNSIKNWEARVVEENARIAEAERLKNNVQRSQAEYDRLSSLSQNFKISRDFDQETIAILEHASPAFRSYSAAKKTIGSGVICGLLLGFGGIALLAFRDQKFGSALEVREKIGDRVIVQVPELPETNGKIAVPPMGALSHVYAESFRSLRSALLFLPANSKPKILLVTSALPNEGKSTVTANLAHALALGGARVLLVDADLRRGALHELLHLNSEPGLTDLLNRTASQTESIQTNSIPSLSFVGCWPAGRKPRRSTAGFIPGRAV